MIIEFSNGSRVETIQEGTNIRSRIKMVTPVIKCKWLTCRHNSKNQVYINGCYPKEFGICRYDGEIELETVECECQEEMEDRLECLNYERRV